MKDFVVDEVQLDLALSLGADAVLLIVAALEDATLARLHRAARERGLAVLVEAHDEEEVGRALAAGAEVVGLNARDLRTFRVDLDRIVALGRGLPSRVVRVAESGIHAAADVERLAAAGFDAFLVGESLLRSGDPARALRALRGEGTTEVKVCGVTREEDLAAAEELGADWIGLNLSSRSPRRVSVERARALCEASRFAKGVVAVVAGNTRLRGGGDRRRGAARRPAVARRARRALRPRRPRPDLAGREGGQRTRSKKPRRGRRTSSSSTRRTPRSRAGPARRGTGASCRTSRRRGRSSWREGSRRRTSARAIAECAPAGVDVASGVESAPGIKDRTKLAAFLAAVRQEKGKNGG